MHLLTYTYCFLNMISFTMFVIACMDGHTLPVLPFYLFCYLLCLSLYPCFCLYINVYEYCFILNYFTICSYSHGQTYLASTPLLKTCSGYLFSLSLYVPVFLPLCSRVQVLFNLYLFLYLSLIAWVDMPSYLWLWLSFRLLFSLCAYQLFADLLTLPSVWVVLVSVLYRQDLHTLLLWFELSFWSSVFSRASLSVICFTNASLNLFLSSLPLVMHLPSFFASLNPTTLSPLFFSSSLTVLVFSHLFSFFMSVRETGKRVKNGEGAREKG